MRSLKWSTSHAVFVTEIDDEHKEIFAAVSSVQTVFTSGGQLSEIPELTQRLTSCIVDHFAHEERLMRAARYGSMRWHKKSHDNARRRVGQFVVLVEQGDTKAGIELVEYLTSWLHDHTRLADRMLGAFLRNHQRCTLTFQAGTKPLDSCSWVTANGDAFNPETDEKGS
jgi:hemerythrin